MESNNKIHVIIPTHNRYELLKRTLNSVASCELPNNFGKIFVVENGSEIAEGLTRSFEGKLPIRYIATPIPNKSTALNLVLEEIPDNDFIIFLDDDVRVAKNLIHEYRKVFEEWGAGCYFGGPTKVDYEVTPKPYIKKLLPPSAKGFQYSYQKPQIVDYIYFLGFNWACAKSDLTKVKGFDPNKGPGSKTGSRGQESDAQARLFESSCKPVYVPNALVYHYVPSKVLEDEWILNRAYQHGIELGLTRKALKFSLYNKFKLFLFNTMSNANLIIPKEVILQLKYKAHRLKGLRKGISINAQQLFESSPHDSDK